MRSEAVYPNSQNSLMTRVRIILAITRKDILEAIKNKSVLSTILSALFIVVAYRILPILERGSEPIPVFVYSHVESASVEALTNSDELDVYTGYETLDAMQRRLADWDVPAVGLVFPEDWLETSANTNEIQLDGYVLSWPSQEDNSQVVAQVEAELSRLLGSPVHIDAANHIVHMWPESDGISTWMGMSAVFAIAMIGMTLIPHLMIEEKQNHTIDFLRVSPASATDLTISKALTGAFYVILAAIVVVSIYANAVEQWWLILLTVLVGIGFLTGVGLIMGTIIKDKSQMVLLGFIIFLPLFFPVFLSLMTPLFSETWISIFKLVPTTVIFNLFRTALSGTGNFALLDVFINLVYLLLWGIVALTIVAWSIRRMDREDRGHKPSRKEALTINETVEYRSHSTTQPVESAVDYLTPLVRVRPKPVLAIFLKDIREAINNKLFISILVGTGFIVLSQSAMQNFVFRKVSEPYAFVYDSGSSEIIKELDQMRDLNLAVVESQSQMNAEITNMPSNDIGITIPENFDELTATQQEVTLEASLAHWNNLADIEEIRQRFEDELSTAIGTAVNIRIDDNNAFPTPGSSSTVYMASIIMSLSLMIISLMLVPVLFVEEIEFKTLQTLLVSPASYRAIVAGKGSAGLAYSFAAAAVMIALNNHLIVHWLVLITAVTLVSFFAVGLGLLIGSLSKTSSTINLWSVMVLLFVLGTGFVIPIAGSQLGETWTRILTWSPGSLMVNLFQYSMVGDIPQLELWNTITGLTIYCILSFALVMVVLRRKEKSGF